MWHLIKTIFYAGPRIIYSFFAWMISYSKHPEKTPLEKRYKKTRSLISFVLKALKVEIIVLGKENIPNTTACYFGNHLSAADPLMYFNIFENPISFVGKTQVKELPFVWRVFTACDSLFLDRNDLKQELRVMMKVEKRLANGETNFYIFPEGTRNKDPLRNLINFHSGTFRSAMKAKVPLVPCINYGSQRVLSFKSKHKKYPTIVKFLEPIMPDEYANMSTEDVANMVQSRIQKELTFNIRKLDLENMSKLKDKNYSFNYIY